MKERRDFSNNRPATQTPARPLSSRRALLHLEFVKDSVAGGRRDVRLDGWLAGWLEDKSRPRGMEKERQPPVGGGEESFHLAKAVADNGGSVLRKRTLVARPGTTDI